eukprot:1195915-Rhodomonas_salina.2
MHRATLNRHQRARSLVERPGASYNLGEERESEAFVDHCRRVGLLHVQKRPVDRTRNGLPEGSVARSH